VGLRLRVIFGGGGSLVTSLHFVDGGEEFESDSLELPLEVLTNLRRVQSLREEARYIEILQLYL